MKEPHRCAAIDCTAPVPKMMAFCGSHWKLLPGVFRALVWKGYAMETYEFYMVKFSAVAMIAKLENKDLPKDEFNK